MSRAYVVPSVEDLNFWLKRFAPRVRMRVSADAVLAVTSSGEVHVPASISFTRGGGKILGIGGKHADALDTVTVRLFTATGLDAPDYDHLQASLLWSFTPTAD